MWRLSEQKSRKNGNHKNEVIALEEKNSEDPIKNYMPSLPIRKEKGAKEEKPISMQKIQKINDELYYSLSMNELFSESTTMDEENVELSEERENWNVQNVPIPRKDEAFAAAKKSLHTQATEAYRTLNKYKGDKYSIIKDAIAIVGGGQNDTRLQKKME